MRIFIGVEVEEGDLKQTLRSWQAKAAVQLGDRWRLTKPDNFHLTLRFLGQTDDSLVDQIVKNLPGWVSDASATSIKNLDLKLLPSDEKIRVIALIFENNQYLQNLVDTINQGLNALGFESADLPFLPHISLARHKGKPLKSFDLSGIEWPVEQSVCLPVRSVILFSSESSPEGVIYRPIFKFSL